VSAPEPASILAHALKPGRRIDHGAAPVQLAERRLAIVQVTARRGTTESLARRLREALGCVAPAMGRVAWQGERAVIAVQPGSWLVCEPLGADGGLESRLVEAAGGEGAVVDQTGGKVTLRLAGRHAPDALAKLVRIDLHPGVFKPGDAAVTPLGHLNAILVQVDAAPTYDLILPSTFAETALESLEAAAAEFGLSITA
jgi:sarcosine oxidase subunit gamma